MALPRPLGRAGRSRSPQPLLLPCARGARRRRCRPAITGSAAGAGAP